MKKIQIFVVSVFVVFVLTSHLFAAEEYLHEFLEFMGILCFTLLIVEIISRRYNPKKEKCNCDEYLFRKMYEGYIEENQENDAKASQIYISILTGKPLIDPVTIEIVSKTGNKRYAKVNKREAIYCAKVGLSDFTESFWHRNYFSYENPHLILDESLIQLLDARILIDFLMSDSEFSVENIESVRIADELEESEESDIDEFLEDSFILDEMEEDFSEIESLMGDEEISDEDGEEIDSDLESFFQELSSIEDLDDDDLESDDLGDDEDDED